MTGRLIPFPPRQEAAMRADLAQHRLSDRLTPTEAYGAAQNLRRHIRDLEDLERMLDARARRHVQDDPATLAANSIVEAVREIEQAIRWLG